MNRVVPITGLAWTGLALLTACGGTAGVADETSAPEAEITARTSLAVTASDGGTPAFEMFDVPCEATPDEDVAAGTTLFGSASQWTAHFFKKSGAKDHDYAWTALEGNLQSDAHIVYDFESGRWFIDTLLNYGDGTYGVQLMVSTDETAKHWKVSVPIHEPYLIDNPQITVTGDKVVVGGADSLWVVDKAALYAGHAAKVSVAATGVSATIGVKFGGGSPPATAYLVGRLDPTHVQWATVDGTQAQNNVNVVLRTAEVPELDEPGSVTEKGGARLESGLVEAMWQAGHLIWADTTNCGSVTCNVVLDIDTAGGTVRTWNYSMPGKYLFYGVPGIDRAGNIWSLMSETNATTSPGLALAGHTASGVVYPPERIVKGLSSYGGDHRWGDFASAAQDPVDGTAWLIGEWANKDHTSACKVVHVKTQ